MKARSQKNRMSVETLEARSLMSTVPNDFNNDGRSDLVEITSPTSITVSLDNGSGGYTVSAVIKAPKNQTFTSFSVYDDNGDGNLDISVYGGSGGPKFSSTVWLGNGDGTFGNSKTVNSHPYNHGGFW
jgi:hypothetical protein